MYDTNPFAAAEQLTATYEPNSILFNAFDDAQRPEWATDAFQSALAGPIADELFAVSDSTPLLRWSDPDVPAMILLDALVHPPTHKARHCDRCDAKLGAGMGVHRLWVVGGQSVVELQTCRHCHESLNDVYRDASGEPGPEHRALVWR